MTDKPSFYAVNNRRKNTAAAILLSLTLGLGSAWAAIDTYQFDNPRQEAQYRALIAEFRCPKCQNQNLAGSDAPIAQDLKQKTYEMVKAGQSDAQIRKYMQERYGDFISYKPPVRPSTWVLWFFPPLLLLGLLALWVLRQRSSQAAAKTTTLATPAPLSKQEQQRLDALLKPTLPADTQPSATQPNSSSAKKGV